MEHRNLTGDDLHEPKGITTAQNDQVYAANGLGTGVWKNRLDGVLTGVTKFGIHFESAGGSTRTKFVPVKSRLVGLSLSCPGGNSGPATTYTVVKNGQSTGATVQLQAASNGTTPVTRTTLTPPVDFAEDDLVQLTASGGNQTYPVDITLRFAAA